MICKKCRKEKLLCEFHKNSATKNGHNKICKDCRNNLLKIYYMENKNEIKNKVKDKRKQEPWNNVLSHIKQRINNKNCKDYKNYGGRGIKCFIIEDELKYLWFRDKAYLMDRPSIDRIDNDGNYELSNCRFIEFVQNSIKDKIKPVLQYDLDKIFLKEIESVSEAARQVNRSRASLIRALNNFNSQCGNFKWRYKNNEISMA